MKKLIALILAVFMVGSLAACGAESAPATKQEESANTSNVAESTAYSQESEAEAEEHAPVDTGALIMYQFDKDNMDVDYFDEDAGETLEDLEKYGDVRKITENGMTFYAVENDDCTYYYFTKADYQNRLMEVDVTLDNFDEYFEMVEEEIWNDDSVEFHQYFRLKDDYLFAMVDYDHLYDNTADATCRPIDYVSTIDVENRTYDWGIYDTRYDETEVWIDFEENEAYVYKNAIVSTYQDNFIEDNGDDTASGVAHEDLTLTNVSIHFYYLNTK